MPAKLAKSVSGAPAFGQLWHSFAYFSGASGAPAFGQLWHSFAYFSDVFGALAFWPALA